MTEDPRGRAPRPDLAPRLRAAALTAVSAGVLLLAAAAFVLSYAGIHRIALATGVSPGLARFYPLIFDAMLVVAGSAVLATRTAGWGTRAYVWGCLLLLLAGVATGDAVHAMNIALPVQQSRAAVAVTPWVLLLLAFGLLLVTLRHFRRVRLATGLGRQSAAAGHVRLAPRGAASGMWALPAGEADADAAPAGGVPAGEVTANPVAASSPAGGPSGGPHAGLDILGGQAGHAGHPGTEEHTEHVVYADPEIANAGGTGEDESEPAPGQAGQRAGPAGDEAGQADGESGRGAGPAASAPIPQFDRLRSGPTPPQG